MSITENQAPWLELDMQRAQPEYKISDVDAAGHTLAASFAEPEEFEAALTVINNWRASHHFPLNTFQTTLRRKAEKLLSESVVVQRVKRLRAIQYKLRKHTEKPIALSTMQDVGGCRAVVSNLTQLKKLHEAYIESDLKHELVDVDHYVDFPKPSGYRGIHLVYCYRSDRKETYNGLKIEVQLRTQLQHAWATAVEIVGFFRQELLKSSEGSQIWKHFFKLMAAEICFEERATFSIPDIPTDRNKVREQLRRCADKLGAVDYLKLIGEGVETVEEMNITGAHYFLLELDTLQKKLSVSGYKFSARTLATMDYAAIERNLLQSHQRDAVLVSAQSMAELRRAYVNYFLDMHRFIEVVETALRV